MPMRIFVFEYLSATPAAADRSLCAQGWAMLRALLADLALLHDVEPVTLVAAPLLPAVADVSPRIRVREAPYDFLPQFRCLTAVADFTLVIAPETDDRLYTFCRSVEESGGRLLGPSAEAVRRTSDKLTLAELLAVNSIPTPTVAPLGAAGLTFPRVVKPRQGAGSAATFLVRNEEELAACPGRARSEGCAAALIQQPYAGGRAASVALLVGESGAFVLPAAEQTLSDDGQFRYRGGRLPLAVDLDLRARSLAELVVAAVPGLRGYVGIDLVLGPPDVVIEINARLTTSYVGLRRLARFNLAEALLAVASGGRPPAWEWGTGEVVFSASGAARCC
jgi:predicted ATP-grasp superfamily ATP-dependent carboligase